MSGKLTTHVLDTVRGVGAAGLRVSVQRVATDRPAARISELDASGRGVLLDGTDFAKGRYEIVFHVGDYLRGRSDEANPFYDEVPVRFLVTDAQRAYHVPLILSAFGYTTYLGS